MSAIKIVENAYWVGAVDWNVRSFHGHTYNTKRGSTYNCYLITGEKTALVDTVLGAFSGEMIENIKQVIDPSKIDYVIANHVETDHSGGIPAIMKLCPKARVYGTAKCKEGLQRMYYGNLDFQVVKTGDKLSLGNKTLAFVEAPMIHWPDSMFTYLVEDAVLLPNDAFGQHYASSERFDDEVDQCGLMQEASKYYSNILWPLNAIIQKKLNDVMAMKLPIKVIAPSHGIIWRKDPMKIVNAYVNWSKGEPRGGAVIVYETMWGATEKMAKKIAEGISDSGIDVKLYDVTQTDITQIIDDMYYARGYVFGSSTHDNNMLPAIAGFLHFFEGLKPKGRMGAAFGSFGWAGGAVKAIEEVVKKSGVEMPLPSIGVQFMPSEDDLNKCREFGKEFAKILK
ncbi:MAG: flavodoxin domain-containing protein [Elusimicrobiota bacterium]